MYGFNKLSFATICLSSMMLSAVLAQDRVCNSVPTDFYVCGDQLTEILELICGGIGNVKKREALPILRSSSQLRAYKKMLLDRSDIPSNVLTDAQIMLDQAAETARIRAEKEKHISKLKQIILNKRQAYAYIGGQDSGIVCECCFHSCDVFELRQYCRI